MPNFQEANVYKSACKIGMARRTFSLLKNEELEKRKKRWNLFLQSQLSNKYNIELTINQENVFQNIIFQTDPNQ